MIAEQCALDKKLAANPEWRWVPGMLARWTGPGPKIFTRIGGEDNTDNARPIPGGRWIPVLEDPATVGALFSVLDNLARWVGVSHGDVWRLTVRDGFGALVVTVTGSTFGEVLAKALIALWDAS